MNEYWLFRFHRFMIPLEKNPIKIKFSNGHKYSIFYNV